MIMKFSLKLPDTKGKSMLDIIENYSFLLIFAGAVIFSTGIGLSIFNPQGFAAIVLMLGGFTAFIFTVVLIFVWLIKDLVGGKSG